MNKRNIALTALVLAAILAGLFLLFSKPLNHSRIMTVLYFPHIVITTLLSGPDSSSRLAGWISFIVYTLLYWGLFLVLYAFLLELHLVRSVAAKTLRESKFSGDTVPDDYLLKLGLAIELLEARRRKHWLLRGVDFDPADISPRQIAARAVTGQFKHSYAARLIKKFEARAHAEMGHERATQLVAAARLRAQSRMSGSSGAASA